MVHTTESGATTTYYFQRNLLGDVMGIYTTSGTKVGGYAYDAWGNCTITLNTNGIAAKNPVRYRGYYYDEVSGLYYLNARYYSPTWRRFISPDDTGYLDPENPNGLNLYAYCNNDPVNHADPTGHSVALILLGTFVLGAVTSGGISFATQLIENNFNVEDVNPWLVFSDAMFGGVSGLLAASGIGALGSAFLGASLGALQLATSSAITGEEITAVDFWITVSFGFIGGFIPKTGIDAKHVYGKSNVFRMHIKNAVGSRRYNMYSQKLKKLTLDVVFCGINYVASTVVSSIASNHISDNLGRYYYGY